MNTKDYTPDCTFTFVRADALLLEEDVHAIVDAARLRGMSPARFVGLAAEVLAQITLVEHTEEQAVDVDFSLNSAMLAAEDVEYESDGTPLCTEAEMCAKFGQDWRDGLDEFIDAMEIEREKERRAAAGDPYAWVRDRYGRLV